MCTISIFEIERERAFSLNACVCESDSGHHKTMDMKMKMNMNLKVLFNSWTKKIESTWVGKSPFSLARFHKSRISYRWDAMHHSKLLPSFVIASLANCVSARFKWTRPLMKTMRIFKHGSWNECFYFIFSFNLVTFWTTEEKWEQLKANSKRCVRLSDAFYW